MKTNDAVRREKIHCYATMDGTKKFEVVLIGTDGADLRIKRTNSSIVIMRTVEAWQREYPNAEFINGMRQW